MGEERGRRRERRGEGRGREVTEERRREEERRERIQERGEGRGERGGYRKDRRRERRGGEGERGQRRGGERRRGEERGGERRREGKKEGRGGEREEGRVHFRYVVFRPFLDEILVGKIKGCSQEGVYGKKSLETTAPSMPLHPRQRDDSEQVWVWEYETEEGAHDLYMDQGEEVRFRVVDEAFVDTSPSGPLSSEASPDEKKEDPYTLIVSADPPTLNYSSHEPQCRGMLGAVVWLYRPCY
ncbi:UNVERIFIED_CONTAM: hypothetical protein FKN15_010523 [Acipenser sinensis]